MTSRLCRACTGFHDLDAPWPPGCMGHFSTNAASGPQIVKDIEPYKAVAVDKRTGKVPKIGSRRAHREFLKANGYVEVGNEPIRERPIIDVPDSHREIKQTLDQFRSEGRWK
jgi:hypothetical protein